MADTITVSRTVEIGIEYESADTSGKTTTHTVTVKLPNYNIVKMNESDIKTAFTGQNVLMVNPYGSSAEIITEDQIYTAATVDQTIRNFDIGWED